MCGIYFSYCKDGHGVPRIELLNALSNRGPDSVGTRSLRVTCRPTASTDSANFANFDCGLGFISTVLSLRGDSIIHQPLEDTQTGSLLCWNGEVWKIANAPVEGNDAEAVLNLLLEASQSCNTSTENGQPAVDGSLESIVHSIENMTGPYAFVFYDAKRHRVIHGRDALGRRSLVMKRYGAESLVIASVSDATEVDGWNEVEADGVYLLDLKSSVAYHINSAVGNSQLRTPYQLVHSPLQFSPSARFYKTLTNARGIHSHL